MSEDPRHRVGIAALPSDHAMIHTMIIDTLDPACRVTRKR